MPVPEGTTLEVTVSVSTESQEPQVVFLAGDSSGVATFTAPPRANEVVVVTAMATTVQTALNARQVAVSAADTLTVAVSALQVQLVLSELPLQPVAIGSTFPVTVATVPALPEGAVVAVTLSLADLSEVEVELRPGASTQSVAVTAPNEAGSVPLLAEGVAAASSVLELNVLAATATVQVQEQVLLSLQLEALDRVAASSTFSVTVRTNEPVPEGATVSVMVTFDGSTQTETLSAGETMATVMFTAPGTTTGIFTVDATGAPSVTDANLLQLTVNPTSTSVEVVPVAIALTLTPTSIVVRANAMFSVEVGTDRNLPAGTVVNVELQFNGVAMPSTLSAAGSTASLDFTAPSEGSLSLVASVTNITQSSPVVAVSVPAPVRVQVTELVTLGLTLEAPEVVTARDGFAVRVSSEPEVPEGATVTVTVRFDEIDSEPVTLRAEATSAIVTLMAPGRLAQDLELRVSGEAEVADANVLQVTVVGTSTEVDVVPQEVQLTLMVVPETVNIGGEVEVTAGVSPALLADTTLTVAVFFGASSQQVTLTDRVSSQPATFTALTAGLLEVSARFVAVEPEGLVVAATVTQTVQVTELAALGLTLAAPEEVEAGSTFSVTVGANASVPEGAEVSVMVTFAGSTQTGTLSASMPAASVVFMAPGTTTGIFTVNATGTGTTPLTTVAPASTPVVVVPVPIALQLAAPGMVDAGSTFTAMVNTDRVLPAGTVVNLTVQFGEATGTVTLSDTMPADSVVFTAPASGVVELTVAVSEITQSSPVVAVSVPAAVDVQVTVLLTLSLTLDVQENVTVGDTLTITVSAPLSGGVEAEVTIAFAGTTMQVTLTETEGQHRRAVHGTGHRGHLYSGSKRPGGRDSGSSRNGDWGFHLGDGGGGGGAAAPQRSAGCSDCRRDLPSDGGHGGSGAGGHDPDGERERWHRAAAGGVPDRRYLRAGRLLYGPAACDSSYRDSHGDNRNRCGRPGGGSVGCRGTDSGGICAGCAAGAVGDSFGAGGGR